MARSDFTIRAERGAMDNALWRVTMRDGMPASFGIYWNGPGSRLMLTLGDPTTTNGKMVTIDAAGYDGPQDDFRSADRAARSFLNIDGAA